MKLKFTYQNLLIFLFLASLVALISAYVSQYVFDLQPCVLCLHQRKPFFASLIISGLFLSLPNLKEYQKLASIITILLIILNLFLAAYHVGVENKIFVGPSTCSNAQAAPNNIEDLKAMIEQTKAIRCDEPAFVFMNISMAGWNVIYCLFLAAISLYLVRKSKE
jgi:disulfide bond formation protein DsbB